MKVKDLRAILKYYNDEADVVYEEEEEKGISYWEIQIQEYLNSDNEIDRNSVHLAVGKCISN